MRAIPSLLRVFEISQIRRRLILPGGHQQPIPAQPIVFFTDDNIRVALFAIKFGPGGTTPRRSVVAEDTE
jgi:hypothetical protein